MREHVIEGGGGLKLHVREWGPDHAPPILLLHGWSQHHLCWSKQYESDLAHEFRIVAPDLRGHGQSEAPAELDSYKSGSLWADDVAAFITALALHSPIVVGSSYGGFIIGDYLRKYGDDALGGINLVGGAIGIGPAWFGSLIGPNFVEYAPPACSPDQPVALAAIQSLVHLFFTRPLAAADIEAAVGWSMLTAPAVRAAMIDREEDFRPEYSALTKPLLVTYGADDTIVLPTMAEAIRECCPACRTSEYAGTAHMPFMEDAERFNSELAVFAREALSRA
jgi:non-heme chloroperoxidase